MKKRLRSYAPVALAIGVLLVGKLSGMLVPLETALVDGGDRLFQRTVASDVVVVEIDARSLKALDRWPWDRDVHARLVRRLNEAAPRAVFFDVDFSLASPVAASDLAFTAALAERSYPFVLPAFWQPAGAGAAGGFMLTQPLAAIAEHVSIGLVNVAPGGDGLVRGLVHTGLSGTAPFASAVSLLAAPRTFGPGTEYPIDFGIAPASFRRVSYVDVLDGRVPVETLSNRVVFVGATALELGDIVPVPVHRSLPGVVLQALGYQTLVSGIPTRFPAWVGLLGGVVTCLWLPVFARASWRRTFVWAGAATSGIIAGALALQGTIGLLIPVMPVVLAILTTAVAAVALAADRATLRAILGAVRLKRHEALISSVLSGSIDGIVVFCRDGIIRDANEASAGILRRSLEVLRGEEVRRVLPGIPEPEDLDRMVRAPDAAARPHGERPTRHGERIELLVGSAEATVPVEVSVTRVETDDRTFYTAIIRDITERKQQQAILKHQATHDALTGLPNRVLLGRALEALDGTTPAALFMLDLDRFKDVNDTLGHATGDVVLTILGQRLRSALPEQNLIARIGGDEFAVVVPSYTDIAELEAIAATVLERVRSPVTTGSNTIEVGASIGIALCPEHGTDGGALLQRADVAMYVAKHQRTSVEFYSAEADRSSIRHLKMAGALRAAIAHDELELFYQPKVRLSDMKCVGVEALARWTHRELGAVSPGEFVPLAEESNLIVPLTRWAMVRALEHHAGWRVGGLDLDLAVNLSARHLRDRVFVTELLHEIDTRGVDPRRVELEITETALMSDPEKAMEVLGILTRAGVRIAMDDFGTGFSSLAYLKHLNLNTLKIDRCFIKDICESQSDLAIVRSTLRMAQSLDLAVVAEGIEDRSHFELLRDLGCDVGQGYWIAKPMPAHELPSWCQAWERGRPFRQPAVRQASS